MKIKFKMSLLIAIFTFTLWAVAGYLSYLSAQYVDLYMMSESNYFNLIDKFHRIFISGFAKFFLYHTYFMFSALVLAFTFSAILSTIMNFKLLWIVGFYVGAAFLDSLSSYSIFISTSEVFENLPAHVVSAMQANLIKLTIVLPLTIYLGAKIGSKLNSLIASKLSGREIDMCFPKGKI